MTIFFGCGKIISVNVANGSKHTILCRVVGDTTLKVQGDTTSTFAVKDTKGSVRTTEQFRHKDLTTPGYTEIQKGNTLKFELMPSSKSVYMTVFSDIENGRKICENYQISRSSNYIINSEGAILNAEKNQKWIDTSGRNHMVTHDDEDAHIKKECSDPNDFRPEIDFNSQFW